MSPRIKWAEQLNLLFLREKHLHRSHPDTSICTRRGLESVPESDNPALGPAMRFIHKSCLHIGWQLKVDRHSLLWIIEFCSGPARTEGPRGSEEWRRVWKKTNKKKKAALIRRSCDTKMVCVFVTKYCYVHIQARWMNKRAELCIWEPVCWKPNGIVDLLPPVVFLLNSSAVLFAAVKPLKAARRNSNLWSWSLPKKLYFHKGGCTANWKYAPHRSKLWVLVDHKNGFNELKQQFVKHLFPCLCNLSWNSTTRVDDVLSYV